MRMLTVKAVLPFVVVAAISMAIAAQSRPASAQEAQQTEANTAAVRHQVLFNRFLSPVMTLFIADADGTRERPLVSTPGLQYSSSYSADGQWVVFTSERDGQSDIYGRSEQPHFGRNVIGCGSKIRLRRPIGAMKCWLARRINGPNRQEVASMCPAPALARPMGAWAPRYPVA